MKHWLTCCIFFIITSTTLAQQFYERTPAAMHWVDSIINKLSKEEKIAQLMVIRESQGTKDGVKFYDKEIEEYIKKYGIGSICLFQGNPVEQADYINRFQKLSKTPLLVCIDGETGLGMRMTESVKKFPDQLTLGALEDTDVVYKVGSAIGEQCKRMGIQVNYAPVVDINNNPDNPVINFRSFGEDKYKVAAYGVQMMKGMQQEGIMACAKHFPGHGDVAVDSHLDLPVITKPKPALDSLELYPFRTLFKAGVGSVMIAHLSIPAIDTTTHLPTSLSRKNVTDLLRKEMDYQGISFTDALEMKGVAKYFPAGDASVQSLVAGNDMLCLPGDIEGSIKKIMHAIKKHKLSWNDINYKVEKVLLAKYHLGLNNVAPVNTVNLTKDLNEKVNKVRALVAENALTLLRLTDSTLLPLEAGRSVAYVGIGIDAINDFGRLLEKKYKAHSYFLSYKDDAAKANSLVASIKNKYDVVIIGLHKYAKYPSGNFGISKVAVDFIKQLQKNGNTISFVFGNPYAVKNICDAPNLVVCYEDDTVFHAAAIDLLLGNISSKGRLPVTVCDEFKYGAGLATTNPFPLIKPERVGLNSDTLDLIDSIAENAIAKHATPGCEVLVAKDGMPVFYRVYGFLNYDSTEKVLRSTIYDLASVTKISATTVSVMKLFEEGKLDINKTLGDYLPWVAGTNKEHLKLTDILMHQAGLVAWIPFYKETIDTISGQPKPGFYKSIHDTFYNVRVADNIYMRKDWVDTMYQRILQSKTDTPGKYVYSDNDFIFLGKIVETLTGKTLDAYTKENFYRPLQMVSTSFRPRENETIEHIAPTEKEKYFRLQLIRGDVHDPGAAMFGGVAGHAGLFSNAWDLAQLYLMLLNGGAWKGTQFFKRETINFFTTYHSEISRRGLGFDKPEKDNATRAEPYPALGASPQTFGHTGFTGTCVWADPKYNLLYIFLSNRICPDGGENLRLSQMNVRSNIQQTIYKALPK